MPKFLAIDTETTGVGYFDTPFCISTAWRYEGELKSDVRFDNTLVVPPGFTQFVFHNAKFDLQKLALSGALKTWDWRDIHDTEAMIHLLNEQQPKALKRLAKDILELETDEATALRAARKKLGLTKADGYDALPNDIIAPYARRDAEFTLLLAEHLYPQIESEPTLAELYAQEQELLGVLFQMEEAGLMVDEGYVASTTRSLAAAVLEADLNLREMTGNEDFNPGSWQQILAVMKERGIDLPDTKKKTLASVDDEFAQTLLVLRHNKKTFDYFKAIQGETKNGILHPNFKQWGTRGRRFAAGEADD